MQDETETIQVNKLLHDLDCVDLNNIKEAIEFRIQDIESSIRAKYKTIARFIEKQDIQERVLREIVNLEADRDLQQMTLSKIQKLVCACEKK